MGRLIDLDDIGLEKRNPDTCINREYVRGWNAAVSIIDHAPTVDAEPVRHGRWLDEKTGDPVLFDKKDGCPERSCKCSLCGEWLTASDEYPVTGNYCPNCGAKMDLEDKNG